jgi:hypothetical protein
MNAPQVFVSIASDVPARWAAKISIRKLGVE